MDGSTEAKHGGRITFDVGTSSTDRPFDGRGRQQVLTAIDSCSRVASDAGARSSTSP